MHLVRSSTIIPLCFLLSLVLSFFFAPSTSLMIDMAELGENSSPPSDATFLYMVYTAKPEPLEESHHFGTLSTLLGCDEAARESLIYVYKDTATGFLAELTTAQAEELKGKPGVLQVNIWQYQDLLTGQEAQKQF